MNAETVLTALGVGSISGLVVSICVLFFARAFFGSYLTEKGKNLATKEDVANITKLVEEVKYRFSTDLEDHRTKNLLRMAALDKRLQAHQEAFSLWRELFFSLNTTEVREVVVRCQVWWNKNCLYLEPEARAAFNTCIFNAANHDAFKKMGNAALEAQNFDGILRAADVILTSVQLPGLSAKEAEQLKNEEEPVRFFG
jgi:hypothetical protein